MLPHGNNPSVRIARNAQGDIEYYGIIPNPTKGAPTDTDLAIWIIAKVTYSGDEEIFAIVRNTDGSGVMSQVQIWDNRASLTYT